MSPEQFVHTTSTKASQVFNIFPQKGSVSEGADADLIVLDPRVKHTISAKTHHSQMDTNVYEGKEIRGKVCSKQNDRTENQHCCVSHLLQFVLHFQVVTTISRGRLAWHNNEFLLNSGSSRFVPTPPGGPMFHGLEQQDGARTVHPASTGRLHHTQPLLQSISAHDEL